MLAWLLLQTDASVAVLLLRLTLAAAIHLAPHIRVVDRLLHAAGTNAIYRQDGLERYFRDVLTAGQHAAGLPVHITSAGQVFLGLRPHDLGW